MQTRNVEDLRVLRLRVAIHSLLLALEAAAYEFVDGASNTPAASRELAPMVPARVAACRALLEESTGIASERHRQTIDAIRETVDQLERAHRTFKRSTNPQRASARLLDFVREAGARAASWL